MPPKRDEAALQEEEELQLAIALSQSEAEEKERMVRRARGPSLRLQWWFFLFVFFYDRHDNFFFSLNTFNSFPKLLTNTATPGKTHLVNFMLKITRRLNQIILPKH